MVAITEGQPSKFMIAHANWVIENDEMCRELQELEDINYDDVGDYLNEVSALCAYAKATNMGGDEARERYEEIQSRYQIKDGDGAIVKYYFAEAKRSLSSTKILPS